MAALDNEDRDDSSVAGFDLLPTDSYFAQIDYLATKEEFLAAVAQVAPRLSFVAGGATYQWTFDGYNSSALFLRVPDMDTSFNAPPTIEEQFDLSFRPWGVMLGVNTRFRPRYELYRLLVVLLDGLLTRAR